MPSNKDLIEQAEKLAGEQGKDITTEGLTNPQLVKLVKNLRADADAKAKADADAKAKADADAKAKADADAKAKGATKVVVLQCKFGKNGQGDKVTLSKAQADDLIGRGWATDPKKDK